MRIKLNKQVFLTALFAILFLPIVQSINLSTIQKNQYSEVRIGESVELIVLFWNSENYSFPIELSIRQASRNLSVVIRPESFVIEPSLITHFPAEKDKEYVDTSQGLMEATPVKIIVKPFSSAAVGEYEVYVKAVAISPEEGIMPRLEKTFKFLLLRLIMLL